MREYTETEKQMITESFDAMQRWLCSGPVTPAEGRTLVARSFLTNLVESRPPREVVDQRQEYVVGFLFWRQVVMLIRKERPAWQRGRLNGVGGHVERGESPHAAMVRECYEESGLLVPEWRIFATLGYSQAVVHFFKANWPDDLMLAYHSRTDERIELSSQYCLPTTVLPNLKWLIPLALHPEKVTPISVELY